MADDDDLAQPRALARTYLDLRPPDEPMPFLAVALFADALAHHPNPRHRRRALEYTIAGEQLLLSFLKPRDERDEPAWIAERAAAARHWLDTYR